MLRLCLGVLLLSIALEAGKSCERKAKKFKKCLTNGFSPKIFTSCQAGGDAMTINRKIKRCTRVENRLSKFCETGSFDCKTSEWTPIYNATTSKIGPFEASKFPDFIVKFTQQKEVDKFQYLSQSIAFYNGAGERIGQTNFILYANRIEDKFELSAYKRFYLESGGMCSSPRFNLDYVTDYNFEMKTAAGEANMYQITTSDGVVHNEDMTFCKNLSEWQEVLSGAEYTAMKMMVTRGSDIADYVTTEYKLEEN